MPISGDTLGGTRDRIKTNFQLIKSVFDENHYTFGLGGQGKHRFVTTPDQITDSITAANEPKMYARATSINAGVLQYSRGGSNAIPTPLTSLHSSGGVVVAPDASTPVLNFAGMPRAMAMVYAFDTSSAKRGLAYVWWNGATLRVENLVSTASQIQALFSGTTLNLRNADLVNPMTIYWTLDLKRTS